jgi:hypothetical protein
VSLAAEIARLWQRRLIHLLPQNSLRLLKTRFERNVDACPYRKSNPDLLVMEFAKKRDRLSAAIDLYSATDKSILAK